MTDQQKRDYLIGRILRYADKDGSYDEALEFIRLHRSIKELNDYQADLTYKAFGRRQSTDENYIATLNK